MCKIGERLKREVNSFAIEKTSDLKIKMQEYTDLEAEIEQLRHEALQANKQQLNLGLTKQGVRV